jgi:hypothetical protein
LALPGANVRFFIGDGRALLEWENAGLQEDLICIGVTNAGEKPAPSEHTLDLPLEPTKSLFEFWGCRVLA